MAKGDSIEFIVGEEKKLTDVLGPSEVMPLLQSAVNAGMDQVLICDRSSAVLWSASRQAGAAVPELLVAGPGRESRPILLEGEAVGLVIFVHPDSEARQRSVVAQVVAGAINAMVHSNLKRILTTEIHTQVVAQSYEEILEANTRLTASEKKYRELAASLETVVKQRTEELKKAYTLAIQQDKMASVGCLAAGIAHEINNPMGFIHSNLVSLGKYVERFQEMISFHGRLLEESSERENLKRKADEKARALKLDWIAEDLHDLLSQSLAGAERIKRIVADLKGFSHVDQLGPVQVNLNGEIERTLNVLSGEMPSSGQVKLELDEIPSIRADGAEWAQVFLNLIRNAIQARPEGLCLHIRSTMEADAAVLEFSDNGPGIAPELRQRVFEPFFTTRDVGQGIGMGLTVAYDIVASSGGSIEITESEQGGACIRIRLPLHGDGLG